MKIKRAGTTKTVYPAMLDLDLDGKADDADKVDGKDASELKSTGGLFGDGSDGDVTISANCTINKIMYYNNLTIDSGVTVTSDKKVLIIYVKNTLTNNGKISMTGKGGSGGGVGSGSCGCYCSICQSGLSGEDGLIAGGSGGHYSYCSSSNPGAGGAGNDEKLRALKNHVGYCEWCNFPNAGAGGGGGDGYCECVGESGTCQVIGLPGDGGAGGGAIYIFAKNLVNNGTIEAKGENGENGTNGTYQKRAGGGGGAGGLVVLNYITKSGTGNIDVSGGNGGTSGCGNGQAGSDGKIFEVEV